jgi:hypothetical protein
MKMPLFKKPSTQDLEDHFFGSGAFIYGWFDYHDSGGHFPVIVVERDEDYDEISRKTITEEMFVEGIKKYAELQPVRSFDDLIEDMDSADVDNVIQLIMFGEIRYA